MYYIIFNTEKLGIRLMILNLFKIYGLWCIVIMCKSCDVMCLLGMKEDTYWAWKHAGLELRNV